VTPPFGPGDVARPHTLAHGRHAMLAACLAALVLLCVAETLVHYRYTRP
jgi:hypothetical protein